MTEGGEDGSFALLRMTGAVDGVRLLVPSLFKSLWKFIKKWGR